MVRTFLFAFFAACAARAESVALKGTLAIWSKAFAVEAALPKPIGVEWAVNAEAELDDDLPNPALVIHERLERDGWQVEVQIYWVRPQAPEIPYLVTQTRLARADWGLVAECSRYDDARTLRAAPPGSCAGTHGELEYGVSLAKSR